MYDDSSIHDSAVETVRMDEAGTERRKERLADRKERVRSFSTETAALAEGVAASRTTPPVAHPCCDPNSVVAAFFF